MAFTSLKGMAGEANTQPGEENLRKKLIVLTTVLGLLAFSGVAAADQHETDDTEDTTFNFGYDEDNGVFIWGSSASDGDFDCTLENGLLEATYGSQDGGLLIEDLVHLEGDDAGSTVEFDPAEEGDPSLEYDPANEDCQLTAGEVAGPQGQINHGMFLKTFNAMFDGQARGCMVRHIAQSDLGKDDQQVNVPDVDPEAEGVEDGDTGEIDFETVLTDCVHGPDEEVEAADNGQGRPDWVTTMIENKRGDNEEVESEDEDSGRRGPPEDVPGNGPRG